MNESGKQKLLLQGKYLLLALLVGPSVGVLDTIFGRVLILVSNVRAEHFWFLLLLPVGGLLIMLLYDRISRLSMRGMTLVFETGLQKRKEIPFMLIPLAMVSTWITHLFGGSAGREGVAVQLGATFSHSIGRRLKLPENGRIMLVTGMAAGFAGLFQTPLSAVFFAMEVITAGVVDYEALIPSLLAAYLASTTSKALGLRNTTFMMTRSMDLNFSLLMKLIVLGCIFGIAGRLFAFLLKKCRKLSMDKIENPYLRIGILAIPVMVILFISQGRYSGLGGNLITAAVLGEPVYGYDWILKLLLTVATLSIGFQGGEVTPLFSVGACLGAVIGPFFGMPAALAASLGYAAVFGSGTNTLLAPICIGLEIFGPKNMMLYIVVCMIAYAWNGNQSIYGAQEVYGEKNL